MVRNIMVVDDSFETRYTIKDGLEELDKDYQVLCVESGITCFEFLEKNFIPDIIILDIMMPDMDGWKIFKKLYNNEKWKKIPVAFLTAKNDNFSRGFGKILAEAYIEKPFEIKELKGRIEKILEKPFTLPDTREKIIIDMIEHIPEK